MYYRWTEMDVRKNCDLSVIYRCVKRLFYRISRDEKIIGLFALVQKKGPFKCAKLAIQRCRYFFRERKKFH